MLAYVNGKKTLSRCRRQMERDGIWAADVQVREATLWWLSNPCGATNNN